MKTIPGYDDVKCKYGEFSLFEFDMVAYFEIDRFYNEDREMFEYNAAVILSGDKGFIEIQMGNIVGLKIGQFPQFSELVLEDIRSMGWDRKNFKLSCLETEGIDLISETCRIAIPNSFH